MKYLIERLTTVTAKGEYVSNPVLAEAHVYLDVTNYYPKVKPGGILCGRDWDAAQVITGVEKALVTLGILKSELVTESPPGGTPPIWWVRKPKGEHDG